jgi:hypothetical protein
MQPHTVHRIAQELRGIRGLLQAENKWAQYLPTRSPERMEVFLRIHFWRDVMKDAERRIVSGYDIDLDDDGEEV